MIDSLRPSPAALKEHVGDVFRIFDGIADSRTPTLIMSTITGSIASIWFGWPLALTWIGVFWVSTYLVFPFVVKCFVEPYRYTDPGRALIHAAATFFIFGSLYVPMWLPALASGDPIGAIFGAMWFSATLVPSALHCSRMPLVMIAAIAPATLSITAAPFFMHVPAYAPWVVCYLVLQTLAMIAVTARDRNKILTDAALSETKRLDAEQASVAKSQFLATMSHELRTPLNAVIGYAEIMREDLVEGRAPDPNDVERIAAAGHSLLSLINDVLDLSKADAGKIEVEMTTGSVEEIVRGAAETCAPIAAKNGNQLTVSIDPSCASVVTDQARLRQCLVNLVSNACKFTHDGDVSISTKRIDGAGQAMLQIQVADTGIGISSEQMARLFQPFTQADSSTTRMYGGTGLGLAITKRLCELLGGEVNLTSVLGRGTVCTLLIPTEPIKTLAIAA